jgi:hypothetical protein
MPRAPACERFDASRNLALATFMKTRREWFRTYPGTQNAALSSKFHNPVTLELRVSLISELMRNF